MPEKKKHLPKSVEPGDVTLPGHFGARLMKGVIDTVNEAVKPMFDGHVQGETMREKKKKR